MAKRYRYAFARQKEAEKGIWSAALAGLSLLMFFLAVLVSFLMNGKGGTVVGGLCIFAMLTSIYGFIQGLRSFSEEKRSHTSSIAGSIANGVIMVMWLGMFLLGV